MKAMCLLFDANTGKVNSKLNRLKYRVVQNLSIEKGDYHSWTWANFLLSLKMFVNFAQKYYLPAIDVLLDNDEPVLMLIYQNGR